MSSAGLRPLGFGELMDRTVTLAVHNAGPLLAAVAIPYVPLTLAQWAFLGDFYAGQSAEAIPPALWRMLGISVVVGLVVFAFARTAAVVIAHGLYLTQPVSVRTAFRIGFARLGAMIALGVVTTFALAAVALAVLLPLSLIVAGIATVAGLTGRIAIVTALLVGMVLAAPFFLWLTLAFEIATVRVSRGASGFTALFTALRATAFRSPWRSLIAAAIASLLSFAVAIVLSFAVDSLPSAALRIFVSLGIGNATAVIGEVLTVVFVVGVRYRHRGAPRRVGPRARPRRRRAAMTRDGAR